MKALSRAEQLQLIARAGSGDQDACAEIYRRYLGSVRSGVGTIPLVDDREDAVQDAFAQIFRKMGTFNGDCDFSSWCWRVAFNVALGKGRSTRAKIERNTLSLDVPADAEGGQAHIPEPSVHDENIDFRLDLPKLRKCIDGLPPCYREVIKLKVEGKYISEIATALGIHEGTVKSHTARAIKKLRAAMNEPAVVDAEDAEVLAEPIDLGPAVVRVRGRRPGASYKVAERQRAAELLRQGVSVRKVAALAGLSKLTVSKVRREIAAELPANCECGRPLGHKGWCAGRVAESPARQETVKMLTAPQSELTVDAVRDAIDKNSVRAAARLLNCTEQRLRKFMRQHNLGDLDDYSPPATPRAAAMRVGGVERMSAVTLTLDSGGTVRMELNCHLFALTPRDRDFIFRVADMMKAYEDGNELNASSE